MKIEILKKYLISNFSQFFSDNLELKEIKESNNNEVYSFGNFIIKVSQDKYNLKNEFNFLKLLEGKGKFPKPISYDTLNQDNIIIISKLEGVGLHYIWSNLNLDEKIVINEEIIKQVKIIHSVSSKNTERNNYISDLYSKLENIKLKILSNPNILSSEYDFIKIEIEKYKSCFNSSKIGIVHNDLWYKNILTDQKHLTGIIDFELGFIGPIELDFLRLLQYKISVLNYIEKEPEHYDELDFLEMLIDSIILNYKELFEKITPEKFYIFNLYSYANMLSKYNESWYNHNEAQEFKKSYCNLNNLNNYITELKA